MEHATQPIPYLPPPGRPEPALPARRAGFWRRHRLTVAMTALAIAGSAAGVGIGLGLTSGGASSTVVTADQAPTTSAPTSPASTGGSGAHRRLTRGVIQAVSGSTWTLRTRAGASITVVLTSQTQFGSPKKPASSAQFAAGDSVIVLGTVNDRQLMATRVVAAPEDASPTA